MAPRVLLLLLLSLGLSACGRAREADRGAGAKADGSPPPPRYSFVRTGDLRAAPQLLSGWYPVEDGAWRWMARRAEAVLAGPQRSPTEFEVELVLPQGHVALTGPVKLTVLFNHQIFAEQTYAADGHHSLTRTVPPGLVTSQPLRVTLEVSKSRPGAGGDRRELGAVILGLGFKEELSH